MFILLRAARECEAPSSECRVTKPPLILRVRATKSSSYCTITRVRAPPTSKVYHYCKIQEYCIVLRAVPTMETAGALTEPSNQPSAILPSPCRNRSQYRSDTRPLAQLPVVVGCEHGKVPEFDEILNRTAVARDRYRARDRAGSSFPSSGEGFVSQTRSYGVTTSTLQHCTVLCCSALHGGARWTCPQSTRDRNSVTSLM